jgi:hypothetical protein
MRSSPARTRTKTDKIKMDPGPMQETSRAYARGVRGERHLRGRTPRVVPTAALSGRICRVGNLGRAMLSLGTSRRAVTSTDWRSSIRMLRPDYPSRGRQADSMPMP